MKLYTYSPEGKLCPGADIQGSVNQKTCEVCINLPYDWDVDTFQERLVSHEYADILLYGCVTLKPGDSTSSVFPESCVLLICSDPFRLENRLDSCLEAFMEADKAGYILLDNSELYDLQKKKFIHNDHGKLKLMGESSIVEEEDDYSDFLITL